MVISIITRNFWKGVREFTANYKDNAQCKVDWCCRVVYEKGDSLFDLCRRAKDAEDFKFMLIKVIDVAHAMGVINDARLAMNKKYVNEWCEVLPSDRLGWWLTKKIITCSEKKKKKWIEKRYGK